jgi:putative membrane protein
MFARWGVIALLALIFVSPLCALPGTFSARVFHHVRMLPWRRSLPWRFRCASAAPPLAVLVGAHAAILWFWHAPGPRLGLPASAYWLMQTSFCKCMVSLAGDLPDDNLLSSRWPRRPLRYFWLL